MRMCISIDVERDYRADGVWSVRGVEDGLPRFLDFLRAREIPFDLMISVEVLDALPEEILRLVPRHAALGCHGASHVPGYLTRLDDRQLASEIHGATEVLSRRFRAQPRHFRAPNFSITAGALAVLERIGYRIDSSVLPSRRVRRWHLLPVIDHRGAPTAPYHPDPQRITRPGSARILEVPVTPNLLLPGTPLGLGFLHSRGPEATVEALRMSPSAYWIFLAHTWEMVEWPDAGQVAPWVRGTARAGCEDLDGLLSRVDGLEFLNMDGILETESQRDLPSTSSR